MKSKSSPQNQMYGYVLKRLVNKLSWTLVKVRGSERFICFLVAWMPEQNDFWIIEGSVSWKEIKYASLGENPS